MAYNTAAWVIIRNNRGRSAPQTVQQNKPAQRIPASLWTHEAHPGSSQAVQRQPSHPDAIFGSLWYCRGEPQRRAQLLAPSRADFCLSGSWGLRGAADPARPPQRAGSGASTARDDAAMSPAAALPCVLQPHPCCASRSKRPMAGSLGLAEMLQRSACRGVSAGSPAGQHVGTATSMLLRQEASPVTFPV